MIKRDKWVYMPHAGHFICGNRCQFKLNTRIGKYIVSTVGEMVSNPRDDAQFETIGCDRKYETMVFKSRKSGNKCCPYEAIVTGGELDFEGYNDADKAAEGHERMCLKWAKKQ